MRIRAFFHRCPFYLILISLLVMPLFGCFNPPTGSAVPSAALPSPTPTAGTTAQPGKTAAIPATPTDPIPTDLPRTADISQMRGFNLLNRRLLEDWASNDTEEWAFRFMQQYGFNFARIPINYAHLYLNEDQRLFAPDALAELDAIIERGIRYDVFILLDLHMIPGFNYYDGDSGVSVWNNEEKLDLWGDTLAMLAERYRDIPPDRMGINLVNEPFGITEAVYLGAVDTVNLRITEISPQRLIFVDGLEWSSVPVYGLGGKPNMVAAPHFYGPFTITHYQADWVEGASGFPEPVFPAPLLPVFVYGPYHEPLNIPLKISAPFKAGMQVEILVDTVSADTDLLVRADGRETFRHAFHSGPGEGEWIEVHYVAEWDIYQNVYQKPYRFTLQEDASEMTIAVEAGDWLSISAIEIANPDGSRFAEIVPNVFDWGVPHSGVALLLDENGNLLAEQQIPMMDEKWMEEQFLAPWDAFAEETGLPVLVGEFGVHNKTPHNVTLRVLDVYLKAFKERGWGWALWNLSDAFGIIDSKRLDVDYENWEGHQLDREMLELLLKYR